MHPPADIPEHAFTADELRAAKPCLKPNRSAGTDTVEAEFIRTLLGTALGFTPLLSLFCRCWSKRTLPSAFELARIVAVYKEKGDPGVVIDKDILVPQIAVCAHEDLIADVVQPHPVRLESNRPDCAPTHPTPAHPPTSARLGG